MQPSIRRETPGLDSVSRRAASTQLHFPHPPSELYPNTYIDIASIILKGLSMRRRCEESMEESDRDDSGVLPGAAAASRRESGGCGHPERMDGCWIMCEEDAERERERERERYRGELTMRKSSRWLSAGGGFCLGS